jgi:hypothetical protein
MLVDTHNRTVGRFWANVGIFIIPYPPAIAHNDKRIFLTFPGAAPLDKNSKSKSHNSLKIKRIYYRYFLYKLLAINELCGILCHCKRGRFTNRPEAKNGQKTRWRKK